jgi:hypothetical protein
MTHRKKPRRRLILPPVSGHRGTVPETYADSAAVVAMLSDSLKLRQSMSFSAGGTDLPPPLRSTPSGPGTASRVPGSEDSGGMGCVLSIDKEELVL